MEKKNYSKPELKSRKVELGVFGDYTGKGSGRGGHNPPLPVDVIDRLNLHME